MATRPSVPAVVPSPPPDELIPPRPPRPSGPLTFRQPEPTSSPTDLPADDSPSLPTGLLDAPPDDPSDAPPTSSKGSSVSSPLTKGALRDAARAAVLSVGGLANLYLPRDELAQANGLYATDADDAEAIGDPLANIAHRHGGIGAAGNPDVADGIMALVGLAMYAIKQLALAGALRAARRDAARQSNAELRTMVATGDASWDAANGPQNA